MLFVDFQEGRMNHKFWRKDVFNLIIVGCAAFVVLTVIAMLVYPGGTFSDPAKQGYSFFENFFSELGFLRTHAGEPNTASLVLFVSAMFLAGSGMALFFLALPKFYRRTRTGRILGLLGSTFGILSALCFFGVAAFPADVNMAVHGDFVIWAFRLFPAAVLCYAIVFFREKGFSYAYAWALVVFLALLVGYLFLFELGPDFKSYSGMVIQAAGQKVIVYASILSVMVQAWGVRRNPN
jgi:hypothetical protein